MTLKILHPTPEQEATIPIIREKWEKILWTTGPCNQEGAKEALSRIYHAVGLPLGRIQTLPSLEAWDAMRGFNPKTRRRLGIAKNTFHQRVLHGFRMKPFNLQLDWERLRLLEIRSPAFWERRWTQTGSFTTPHLWSAYWDYILSLGIEFGEGTSFVRARLDLLEFCRMAFLLRGVAFLIDFPQKIHRDTQGRIHNEFGPAIIHTNGDKVYAWHGIRVDSHVIEHPEVIRPDDILREKNLEVARVKLIRMGEEKFLPYFKPVGEPFRGSQLYAGLFRSLRSPLFRVRCVNSTAEPDGTFKIYWLRVPPNSRCAQEALAHIHVNPWRESWSEYAPVIET